MIFPRVPQFENHCVRGYVHQCAHAPANIQAKAVHAPCGSKQHGIVMKLQKHILLLSRYPKCVRFGFFTQLRWHKYTQLTVREVFIENLLKLDFIKLTVLGTDR